MSYDPTGIFSKVRTPDTLPVRLYSMPWCQWAHVQDFFVNEYVFKRVK